MLRRANLCYSSRHRSHCDLRLSPPPPPLVVRPEPSVRAFSFLSRKKLGRSRGGSVTGWHARFAGSSTEARNSEVKRKNSQARATLGQDLFGSISDNA